MRYMCPAYNICPYYPQVTDAFALLHVIRFSRFGHLITDSTFINAAPSIHVVMVTQNNPFYKK